MWKGFKYQYFEVPSQLITFPSSDDSRRGYDRPTVSGRPFQAQAALEAGSPAPHPEGPGREEEAPRQLLHQGELVSDKGLVPHPGPLQVKLDAESEHFFTDEDLECTCEPINACMGRCKALTRWLSLNAVKMGGSK